MLNQDANEEILPLEVEEENLERSGTSEFNRMVDQVDHLNNYTCLDKGVIVATGLGAAVAVGGIVALASSSDESTRETNSYVALSGMGTVATGFVYTVARCVQNTVNDWRGRVNNSARELGVGR